MLGSRNQIANTYAIMKAFQMLKPRENVNKPKAENSVTETSKDPEPKKVVRKPKKA
jgi:hypothetical protein